MTILSKDRWVTLPVLVGGSLVALIVSIWGIVFWHMPMVLIYLCAVPFVFLSANFHKCFAFLGMWVIFTVAYLVMGAVRLTNIRPFEAETVEWASLLFAAWVIYHVASQKRNSEQMSRRRIHELEVMNQTLTGISSELEISKLLQVIVQKAVQLLDVTLGELLLYDKKTGDMTIVAQYPMETPRIGFTMKPGEGAMGRVAVTKKPLILNDYKAFCDAISEDVIAGVEATMDVPLLKGNELIGVLGVARHDKRTEFTENDLRLLSVFASQTLIAIENARLYEEVQRMAFTDVLTGISNRRHLFELAEAELRRALRYQRPLSIVLIDIDHFKSINDLYGHLAGDITLKWFADICRTNIRQKVDICARFGGEEFAILYPETKLSAAIEAAKRLQQHVADCGVRIRGTRLGVTFSAGIVSMQGDKPVTLDQLIERADRAMYAAKQRRNCLAYWDDKDARSYLLG